MGLDATKETKQTNRGGADGPKAECSMGYLKHTGNERGGGNGEDEVSFRPLFAFVHK
jgi:hypothetical protein